MNIKKNVREVAFDDSSDISDNSSESIDESFSSENTEKKTTLPNSKSTKR